MTAGEAQHRVYLNKIKREIKKPLRVQPKHIEENSDILLRKKLKCCYDELFGTTDEDE